MLSWSSFHQSITLVLAAALVGAGLWVSQGAVLDRTDPAIAAVEPEPAEVTELPVPAVEEDEAPVDDAPAEKDRAPAAELKKSTRTFTLLGVTWDPGAAETPAVEVRWRSLVDGWSDWTALEPSPADVASTGTRPGTEPLWVGESDGVDVRVSTPSGRAPEGVRVATVTDGEDGGVVPTAATVGQPKIISRSAWGAKSGSSCSAPVYGASMLGTSLHHTAGSNSYTKAQSAGIVRATQAYHTGSQGWCDIGYNFLVDKYGQIFEGRKGGITKMVRAAHAGVNAANERTIGVSMMGNFDVAAVPSAMKTAVADLVAWRHSLAGLKATGTYSLGGKTVDRIMGHRDVKGTACPGRYGYTWLTQSGGLRSLVAKRLEGGTAAPTPTPSPTPTPTTPRADTVSLTGRTSFTVAGRGYGHGIGMSQYGAKVAAERGSAWTKILAYYYPGTAVGTTSGSLRVLLSADTSASVDVKHAAGMALRVMATGKRTALPSRTPAGRAVERWRIMPTGTGGQSILQWRIAGAWSHYASLRWSGDAQLEGPATIAVVLPSGSTVSYRGAIRSALPSSTSTDRDTVNVVSVEDYVRGVVAAEMPSSWATHALRAQSVAARTYGIRARTTARHYDICDTTSCQVYRGASAETAATDAAVKGTAGRILTYDGKPALAQFSSSSGGRSADGTMPYLKDKLDWYDELSKHEGRLWSTTVKTSTIAKAQPSVGTPTKLQVVKRTGTGASGGRVVTLRITGTKGTVEISGNAARTAMGLRSNWFTFP